MAEDRYAFLRELDLFADETHKPFHWQPESLQRKTPAALLIHGFPGTPADMRPMGHSFLAAGWAAHAPLLPGFGPAIATLPERRFTEWVEVVREEVAQLRRDHEVVIVVGHSMGAAFTVLATAAERVSAQVLLAPYWRFGGPAQTMLWPVLRWVARRWRPLRAVDLDEERIRDGIRQFGPEIDLDDALTRERLRDLVVPTELLDELRRLGDATNRMAPRSDVPTLVVQGRRDGMVRPRDTDRLIRRLPCVAGYELLDSTHRIVDQDDGAWERVERAVMKFAQPFADGR